VCDVTALRRFAFPLRLARARLARRTGRLVLVALGLAAAAATVAAVLAGSLVAQDRSIAREIEDLPEPARAIRAVWFGVPPAEGPGREELAVAARAALREVVPAKPEEVVLFRRTNVGGALVDLGAVEGLARWIDVRSGRLPRTCRPERCEVLQLAGRGPTPHLGDLRFAVVGRAVLRSDVLFGEFLPPGVYHQPATPPLLLADGLDVLAAAPELESRYRSYAWVVPLDDVAVRPWETDALGDRVARARSSLRGQDSSFDVAAPVAEIARAGEEATAAGRRLLLVGGQAAALLLAFAVLAAAALRRDVAAARRRLTWFGARRAQLETLTLAEVAAVGLVGTLAGWAVGVGIAAVVAERAGAPVAGVLLNSVLSTHGLVVALALVLVTTLVVFLAVRAQPLRVGGLALAPVDVAALGALAVVATILLRGAADADALAREGGTGAVLLLLPGLVSFIAAVACARALGPALRGLERVTRRRGVPLRLASLSLARSAGHATVAIAFLTVSLGLALFAEAYRSTLARGQEDQAAYAAPVEAIAREDLRELVRPLDAASPQDFAAVARGGRASAVLRRSGNVARLEGSRAVTLLALPEAALRELDGWRGDFASRSPDELARLVAPEGESALRGIPLPDDVRELRLPTDLRGTPIRVTATLATPVGRFVPADFGLVDRGRGELRVPVPPDARGGLLVGLTFRPPRRIEEPGASAGRPALGVLTVGRLELVGARTTQAGFGGWIPPDPSIAAVVAGRRTQFHFALTNLIHARFRPRQPTDGNPVPVLATPRVAAAAGARRVLPVELGGQTLLGQVVGVVRRFPTVDGEAVVADAQLIQTALNANQPGSALPNEVWLDVAPEREAALVTRLASPPFDRLELTVRSEVERGLRADPLARAALLTLATAALVGLGLALVGLLLGALSELRDERGELFDLEAQGATPADLRRQVRLRAAIVAVTGLVGGLLTGLALGALVVDLVRLTANAAALEPPLRLALSWPVALAALALYALAATVLIGAATRRAFRAPVPPARASELAA
jgi:hypothetical protein